MVNPSCTEYADALIQRFEERGVSLTDHSRRLVRLTVVGWLEEFLLLNDARKRVSRTPASAFVRDDLVAETPGNVLKNTRQGFLRWIARWTFFIGFKLVGLFALWTLSLHFDEDRPPGVKK